MATNKLILCAIISGIPNVVGAQQPYNSIGTIIGNQGIITQGQQGNNVINLGPQRRSLDSPNMAGLKAQLLSQLPRDKPINITTLMGDTESIEFGLQIFKFLKDNGFPNVGDGISQSIFTGAPPHGLHFNTSTNEFIVGANLP